MNINAKILNKEIKKFLEVNANENTTYWTYGTQQK
jgi:hypothetical protein